LAEVREQARQRALDTLERAANEDWRAAEAWLKYAFWNDYQRRGDSINVTAQQAVVITDEQRRELIDMRQRLLANDAGLEKNQDLGPR
jgi:hypothetical protein